MNRSSYFTLHPLDKGLQKSFQYGDMWIEKKPLDEESKHGKTLIRLFEAYRNAGILPRDTYLMGDYLEHTLSGGNGEKGAGRYVGVVLPRGNYHYLRIDGESIGVEKHKLAPPDEVTILTDTCLFCTSSATATLENGERISLVAPKSKITSRVRELHISERMCFYEIDTIARLSDVICSLKEGNPAYKTAIAAMPTIEYYFYLMDAYNRGYIDRELMNEWIDQVDRRAENISGALSKRIDLKIEACQPLGSVEDYVKECVAKGAAVDFSMVKEILTEGSDLWREVLSYAEPKGWEELNYINYVVAVLQASLLSQNHKNRLTLYIENPSEQRILRNAAKIVKNIQQREYEDRFRVVGIYPHEKVFVSDNHSARQVFQRLYYLGEDQLADKGFAREIIEANRQKLEGYPKFFSDEIIHIPQNY